MKTFNYIETIAILLYKQISFNSFKNEIMDIYISITTSDGAALVLELWEMQSTSSLPSLPGSLWPVVVAPDRVLSMVQTELFDS